MKAKATIAKAANLAAAFARGMARVAASAMVWLLLLAFGGAGAVVIGVLIIAGQGWACIAAGTFLLCGAAVLYRGLNNA